MKYELFIFQVVEVLDWMESTGTNDSESTAKKVKGPLAKGLKVKRRTISNVYKIK